MKIFLIVLCTFSVGIILNILIGKLIINTTIKKYIKPYFLDNKIKLEKYQSIGIFNFGAFGKRKFDTIFVPQLGNIFNDTYINLDGTD